MNIKATCLAALRRRPRHWLETAELQQVPPPPSEAMEGTRAYIAGVPLNANSHAPGQQHEDWNWGWMEGENVVQYERD